MDSIDPHSGVFQNPAQQNGSVLQQQSKDQVSQGFSHINSVSSLEESNKGQAKGQALTVRLNQPAPNNVDGRDLLQRAFDARLDGFRAAVHEFNRRFNAQDIDINDSQSLILMIKRMLSDTQALVSASTIDQTFSNRAYDQRRRQGSANKALTLKGNIRSRTQDLTDRTTQRDTRAGDLANKNQAKTRKEQQLADARARHSTDNDESEEIARLTKEISQLEQDIVSITKEVNALNQQIQALEADNARDNAALLRANRQLNTITEEFVRVYSLLGRIRQRFDPAALETGEEGVQIVKELEQMVQKEQVLESRQREQNRDEVKSLDKQYRRENIQVEDDRIEREEGVGQYLTNDDLETLRLVFSPSDPAELSSATQRLDAQSETENYPSAEEGFAIVLNSVPLEKALEDAANPAAEAHRGDNLSFEGASSPQVFARLWMEAKLKEGKETQDVKEDYLNEVAENADSQRKSVAEHLQDFESIPLEVAESLEKQQEAAIQISKHNRV